VGGCAAWSFHPDTGRPCAPLSWEGWALIAGSLGLVKVRGLRKASEVGGGGCLCHAAKEASLARGPAGLVSTSRYFAHLLSKVRIWGALLSNFEQVSVSAFQAVVVDAGG
jgi:hypothetical protein